MADFDDELARLDTAMAEGSDVFEPYLLERAQSEAENARRRRDQGLGVTVAVLAGGTGSGKSTLFNALTGLRFADAGEIRPTTMQPTACVWATGAEQLLDTLGVPRDRRISGNSILTTPEHTADNLVLLDLPDHDSVAASNAGVVNRILPLADLIVWVLDPQKYADNLIHASYLSAMRERAGRMVVAVNQMDTVPRGREEELLADVRRLLAADGMEGIEVFAVSALKKTGLSELWAHIRRAAAAEDSAEQTAAAELRATRRRLGAGYESAPPDLTAEDFEPVITTLYDASGIPSIVSAISESGARRRALPKPEQPSLPVVSAARESWVDKASHGLPTVWRQRVAAAAASPEALRRRVGTALRSIPAPKPGRFPWLWVAFAAVLVVAGAAAMAGAHGSWILLVAAVLAELVLCYAGVLHERAKSRRAAEKYASDAREAISRAVTEDLVAPIQAVLERYGTVREALLGD